MSERLAILARMAAQYPTAKIQEPTIAAYMDSLREMPEDVLRAACERAARKCKWFPTIAELWACARRIEEHRTGLPSASEAWEFVLQNIGGYGPARSMLGKFTLAGRAVGMIGGWRQLGMGQVTDRPWRRKEFLQAYKALLRNSRCEMLMSPAERTLIYGEGSPSYFQRTGQMEQIGETATLRKIAAGRTTP